MKHTSKRTKITMDMNGLNKLIRARPYKLEIKQGYDLK